MYLEGADDSAGGPSALRSSLLRFASGVIGNLGAPLDVSRRFDDDEDGDAGTVTTSRNPLADGLLGECERGPWAHDM